MRMLRFCSITTVFMLAIAMASAQVPEIIIYLGRLVENGVLVNRLVQMQLRLYSEPQGGPLLYEDSNMVAVVDGLYSTYIGDNATFGTLTDAVAQAAAYIEVVVDGVALSPRDRLTSVAYALGGVKGPTGDKGPMGDKGPTGNQGPQGIVGVQGPIGDKGPLGDQGPLGDKGPTGDQGLQGLAGVQGPAGDKGTTGDQGPQGIAGVQGPIGDKGPLGDQGPLGDKGPTGDQGPVGDKGATGDQGPVGPAGPLAGSNKEVIFNDAGTAAGAGMYYDKLTGNVGIGTANPTNKLAVDGIVKAKGVRVTMDGWADFVFDDGYPLMPLAEVERFVQENRHLPGIPSAKDVAAEDVDLGDMQRRLMQKIEELTLHAISLEKRLQEVERTKTKALQF